MAHLMVQHPVQDYVVWKKGFDSAAAVRAAEGVQSTLVLQETDNPNMVSVLLEMDSLKQAREFADSPRLNEAMGKHGVKGTPCFYFLNKV